MPVRLPPIYPRTGWKLPPAQPSLGSPLFYKAGIRRQECACGLSRSSKTKTDFSLSWVFPAARRCLPCSFVAVALSSSNLPTECLLWVRLILFVSHLSPRDPLSLAPSLVSLLSCHGLSVPSLGTWLLLPAVLSLIAQSCSCLPKKNLGNFIYSTFNDYLLRAYCVPGTGLGPGPLRWDSAVTKMG